MIQAMAEERKVISAEEAITRALQIAFDLYGSNLTDYFRDVIPSPPEQHEPQQELAAVTGLRFHKR